MDAASQQSFFNDVYKVVAQIPTGKVISYGQIATLLGNPRAARVVGWAMSTCPEELPWQRVVKADGAVTGGQWEELRRKLLSEEGVEFLLNGKVDMESFNWKPESVVLGSDERLDSFESLDADIRAEIADELDML